MKKHIKSILAYLLGTIGLIAAIWFSSSLYTYFLKREGEVSMMIASGSILLILIILGIVTWRDIPFVKKLGMR